MDGRSNGAGVVVSPTSWELLNASSCRTSVTWAWLDGSSEGMEPHLANGELAVPHEPSPFTNGPTDAVAPLPGVLSTAVQVPLTSVVLERQESPSSGKTTSKWLRSRKVSVEQVRLQVPADCRLHWVSSRQLRAGSRVHVPAGGLHTS